MIRRPPRSTQGVSSAASDVYKRQILGSRNWAYMQDRPTLRVSLVNEKGKVWWMFIDLSMCSTALGIIDILNDTYAKIKVEKDERGNLTGNVEILV